MEPSQGVEMSELTESSKTDQIEKMQVDLGQNLDQSESHDDEDDSEMDDDDDDEAQEALEKAAIVAINRLQDEISMNQYDYEKHLELIKNLQFVGELELLRISRERLSLLFPLPSSVWLEWIKDEKSLAETEEQKAKVAELYETALGDFITPELWLSYCEFAVLNSSTDKVRLIFERALNAVGSHFLGGRELWSLYMDYEAAYLEALVNPDDIATQVQKFISIIERRLSVPLKNMDKDLDECKQLLGMIRDKFEVDLSKELLRIEEVFKQSQTLAKEFEVFEKNIGSGSIEHYQKYFQALKKRGLHEQICLYERAVAQHFNNPELWLEYLKFSDSKLVLIDILLPVYQRATRNCPSCSQIWTRYMLVRERLSTSNEELVAASEKILEIYKEAIQVPFASMEDYKNLTVSYMNFLRRKFIQLDHSQDSQTQKLREEFNFPVDTFVASYGIDNSYEVLKFAATIEAKVFKDLEASLQACWEKCISQDVSLKNYATFWVDYANHVQSFDKSDQEYRSILLEGLVACQDYPEVLGNLLMEFERDKATDLKQFLATEATVDSILKKWNARREKEAKKDEEKKGKGEAHTNNDNDKKGGGKKRKNEDEPKGKKEAPKKKKVEESSAEKESSKHGTTVQTDPLKISQTLFLSNLSFEVEEDEIQSSFAQFGDINEVRLVRNFKGKSKGYAYVEFKEPDSVPKALANDRMMLHGRPVFISEMDKKQNFTYSLNAEKKKLFVKNIPLAYSKDDIVTKIFTEFEKSVRDVRLVTYKNGFSKGWAYVEFKDEQSAATAAQAKNDMQIEDRTLFVAISDPSKSNKVSGTPQVSQDALALKRPATSIIPSSVQRFQKARLQTGESFSGSKPASSDAPPAKNLSNDQFRALLLKK